MFTDELPSPVEDSNMSGTNASECSETVNECIPNATSHSQPDPLTQPDEENGKVENPLNPEIRYCRFRSLIVVKSL